MKKLLTVLMVVGVSLLSAQDFRHSGMRPQANAREDSLSFSPRPDTPDQGTIYAAQDQVRSTEQVDVSFREGGKPKPSGARTFVTALREEMNILSDSFPDLSLSWLGVSCYVRNPLRYTLSPGNTYAHQMGFRTGDWILTVDGIKTDTFQDLDIALQCPVGKRVNLFIRYSDMQYKVDFHAFGRLPWE